MFFQARLAVPLALAVALFALPSAPAAAQETVSVSLTEFQVIAVPAAVIDGTVVFQVSNDGASIHNLRAIRTDLAPDSLPLDDTGLMVDEGQVDIVAASADLASGQAADVSADLRPGSYVLICNIPTHYDAGMRLGFQVTAAPEATATAVAGEPTATPPTGDGAPVATATPATPGVNGMPATGQGPQASSPGGWAPASLAGLGAAFALLGATMYRRARKRRQG